MDGLRRLRALRRWQPTPQPGFGTKRPRAGLLTVHHSRTTDQGVAATGTLVIAATTCCRSSWEPPPHDRATSSAPSCALRVVDQLADRPPGLQALLGGIPGRAWRRWVLGGCKQKECQP